MRFSDNDSPRSIEIAGHAFPLEQVANAVKRSLLMKQRLQRAKGAEPLPTDNLHKEQD